jgi:hypothetical protein
LLIQNRGIFGLILFTIYCFYFPYVDASINGMGTILMITIIIAALFTYQKGNMEASYILATISIIARPEGSLFLASIIIVSILMKRRAPSIISIVICALVLLIWLIPTYLYFGNILPESVMAKSSLFAGNEWSGIQSGFFEKGIMLMFGLSDKVYFSLGSAQIILWFVSFGITILFVIGLFKGIKAYPTIVISAIFFILLLFFYFFGSPVRMFSWYTILPSIVFMLVAAAGVEYLVNNIISAWLGRLSLGIIFLLCIGSILYGSPRRAKITHEIKKDKKLIHYLDKNASGIKSIMISDIGYIGYFKTWRIIDGSGLISPQVLTRKDGGKLPYLSDIFNKEKPDVIFFKVGILHSDIIKENMRYATFRDSAEKGNFLNDYQEVSNSKDFAEVFVRKSLLSNPSPKMLK